MTNSEAPVVNQQTELFDVAIVGGGFAGAVAAIGLSQLNCRVALIESILPVSQNSVSFDTRCVALSRASIEILKSLAIWPVLADVGCSIRSIHVSDRGQFGFVRMDAPSQGLEEFGQVLSLEQSGARLWQQIEKLPNISRFCPAKVTQIVDNQHAVQLTVDAQQQIYQMGAKIVLAADGSFSGIAEQLGLKYQRQSYQQSAVIANIQTEKPHQHRAFERFTEQGPLALLPLRSHQMSLVWCQRPENSDKMMQLSDHDFCQQLQSVFGYRLGQIQKTSKRYSYPLASHWPEQSYLGRVLLMGNAAHTIHPIAGQGINLGLRDIAHFLEQYVVFEKRADGSVEQLFARYVELRQNDWNTIHLATDGLARLFSHELLPLVIFRNMALKGLNRLPFLKRHLTRQAMGYIASNAKLARGVSLQQMVSEA